MDEDKVIRPMDFVRLTNIDESNVIKDTKNHIGLVKEVSRDGRMSIGNYIPVYTSLSIIITNSHKLIGIEFVRNKERR